MTFDGGTYSEARDGERLRAQYRAVFNYMLDGQWHTLQNISDATGGHPTPSVSARLRDMRKVRFGRHTVERRHITRGLWEYRLIPNRIILCRHGLEFNKCMDCYLKLNKPEPLPESPPKSFFDV